MVLNGYPCLIIVQKYKKIKDTNVYMCLLKVRKYVTSRNIFECNLINIFQTEVTEVGQGHLAEEEDQGHIPQGEGICNLFTVSFIGNYKV